jgi:uncharacterized membrane-anchored protein
MKTQLAAALLFVATCLATGVHAEEAAPQFNWQRGPATGAIGENATLAIPKDYVFLNVAETTRYVELSENIPTGDEQLFAPTSGDWDAYFSFEPEGYVKDDETLDADALLASMKSGQEESNAERRRRGWPALDIVGWHIAPRYNPQTKVLEWATILKAEGSAGTSINYNTRVLGRKGIMTVQLVSTPEKFDAALVAFKDRLDGFAYKPGDRYADYRAGDHVAEYGLAALVAGGAAAVAAKKGFFGMIAAFFAAAWKLILPAFLGLGVWLKSLFGRKKGAE